MRSKVWAVLAVAVAICWTLLPMYWFLKAAFETIGEMAHYPPYFFPPNPQPGAFFNILGFPTVPPPASTCRPPARRGR